MAQGDKDLMQDVDCTHGLELDEIPYELQIPTDLEQQLFATCLIFMKVTELPKTRMKGQKDGKMVNVLSVFKGLRFVREMLN